MTMDDEERRSAPAPVAQGAPWQVRLRSGLTLHGLSWGEAGAPVLLALHGWLDNAASFARLAPLLAHRFRILAVDLPGHGRSDHLPRQAIQHFIDWCVWCDELIAALEAAEQLAPREPLGLLGHSMGAAIASLYGAVMTRPLSRLILIDGLIPSTQDDEEAPDQLKKALSHREKMQQRENQFMQDDAEALERMRRARMPMSPEGMALLRDRALVREGEHGVRFSHDPMLQSSSLIRLTEGQARAFLRELSAPVLLVRAEQGIPVDLALYQERVGCVADLTQVTVPGGHHVHLDAPQAVAREIVAWLDQ